MRTDREKASLLQAAATIASGLCGPVMAGDTRDLPEADRERVAQQAFDIAMRLETLTEKSGDQSGRWKAEVVG